MNHVRLKRAGERSTSLKINL